MLVTPFRDGMNLVAKEYVACRVDNTGVLVLSEFTGSALELKSAIIVNPHDVDGLSAAYVRALRLPRADMVRRMRSLRAVVKAHDVIDWGESFLRALET
jgi:trehalose 6-phosphate synthase